MKVRKTKLSEAIQINSDADRRIVLGWLALAGIHDPDLSSLEEQGAYFLRDEGSTVVYISPKEDFSEQFEVVGELPPPTDHLRGFTF